MSLIIDEFLGLTRDVINKIFPDPAQRAKAELELFKIKQEGKLNLVESKMSAILAEANSKDPWTSRARPSFMYIFYFLLLTLIVFAPVIGIKYPEAMNQFYENVTLGFHAIPEELWWTFSAGYLGYATARTYEKKHNVTK